MERTVSSAVLGDVVVGESPLRRSQSNLLGVAICEFHWTQRFANVTAHRRATGSVSPREGVRPFQMRVFYSFKNELDIQHNLISKKFPASCSFKYSFLYVGLFFFLLSALCPSNDFFLNLIKALMKFISCIKGRGDTIINWRFSFKKS